MATLILGTVGRVFGGPVGGIVGTLLGGGIDSAIFGGQKAREGPRLANLAVQSAAYGEPLPRLYGRMRVAGNLVWTAGIKESRSRSGGGKGGQATNTYSYSSSFAVIVSARAIIGVERIWADGKLLRTADGTLNFPATVRVWRGGEDQPVDPLIAAAEGPGAAPAYRGRALVVFEDLPLADYGNRIPNLTFEVVADASAVGLDAVAADLGGLATPGPPLPVVVGFAAAQAGTIRQVLTSLSDVADLAIHDDGIRLSVGRGSGPTFVADADAGATDRAALVPERTAARAADTTVPDAIWLSYSDPARDYQAGIQAAVLRTPALRVEHREVAVAVSASDAKSLAGRSLRQAIAGRTTARLVTSWRHAGLQPGATVLVGSDPIPWRVTHRTITGALVEFDLARMMRDTGIAPDADAGRRFAPDDAPVGPTILHVLELPALPGPLPTTPRLLLAAEGGAAWRGADVLISRDGGDSYSAVSTIQAPATLGRVIDPLGSGTTDRWDRRNMIEVELTAGSDDLQSTSEAAVLAGANLAAVGQELIQFATAEMIGVRRFRLSNLLRGRRGTENMVASHGGVEVFVLLDARVVPLDLPLEAIGSPLLMKASGRGDDPSVQRPITITPYGLVLRPLSPVGLSLAQGANGDRILTWIRRSRAGFAWSDGTDVPLAEDGERYQVTVSDGGGVVRQSIVTEPRWTYAAADMADDARLLGSVEIAVAQVSGTTGAGQAAVFTIASGR